MFHAIKGGCNTSHTKGFQISRPNGLNNYVILIIKSYGEFMIKGKPYTAAPGSAILFAPDTPYSYGNPNGTYTDDWLHFAMEDAACAKHYHTITNQVFSIQNIDVYSFYIRQILWESSYGSSTCAQQNINALFTVLLNHLLTDFQTRDDFIQNTSFQIQLQNLRLTLQNSVAQKHTIQEHAKEMGISEYYFQHLYTNFFGISFQQDLIQMRIDYAKYLLETTSLSMKQIAETSGYSSQVHFFRQFKQQTGITPAKYRKEVQ